MKIESAVVGLFEENTYLVYDEHTREAVFVDPGDEAPRLIRMVEKAGVTLQAIWLTHAHLDHIGGIAGIKRKWDVPVHLHPADRPVYEFAERSAAGYSIDFDVPPPPDLDLATGDVLRVGSHELRVLHVPGHAPGHVVFLGDGVMLGGDLLFAGSVGRVDLPMSDPSAMDRSLEQLKTLPRDMVVHPGHGPATTIGRELDTNPFLTGAVRLVSSR